MISGKDETEWLVEHGRMDLRMEMIEKRQESMARDIEQIKSDLHEVRLLVAEAKGAWRAAITIAGIGGAVVGALMSFAIQILNVLGGKP